MRKHASAVHAVAHEQRSARHIHEYCALHADAHEHSQAAALDSIAVVMRKHASVVHAEAHEQCSV